MKYFDEQVLGRLLIIQITNYKPQSHIETIACPGQGVQRQIQFKPQAEPIVPEIFVYIKAYLDEIKFGNIILPFLC